MTILKFILVPYRYEFHRYESPQKTWSFKRVYFSLNDLCPNQSDPTCQKRSKGPFLRQQNLIQIAIHTAATTHRLAGLDMEEAQALRQQIIELVKVAKEDV